MDWLANHGYDPDYGARLLKRLSEKEVLDALSTKWPRGKLRHGETDNVNVEGSRLVFPANRSPRAVPGVRLDTV